jgi:hypothetical protein
MADLPRHATAVIVNDQLRLRVYRGRCLEIEMPLRQRQALVLAAQLLNHALMSDGRVGGDPLVLETPGKKDVANVAKHTRKGGDDR